MRSITRFGLATAAGVVCLFANVNWPSSGSSTLITRADARAGHPLTPASVAGVHRRVSRRADRRDDNGGGFYDAGYSDAGYSDAGGYGPGYYGQAYYGAGGYGPGAYGPGYYGPGPAPAGPVAEAVTTGAAVGAPLPPPGPAPAMGPPAPNYPDWAPAFVHDAVMVGPGQNATVIDPATGRACTIQPSGYQWCWTP